jgi:hypothetical protein
MSCLLPVVAIVYIQMEFGAKKSDYLRYSEMMTVAHSLAQDIETIFFNASDAIAGAGLRADYRRLASLKEGEIEIARVTANYTAI